MFSRLRSVFDAEQERLILFAPVFLALGSAVYFSLTHEPPGWLGAGLLGVAGVLTYIGRRIRALKYAFMALMLVATGITLGQVRTAGIKPSALAAPLNFAHVKGKLESIEQTPKGSKIILKNVGIEELAPENTPQRISLTLKSYDATLMPGQIVRLRAGLFPPPQPALPGGFDFARHYYFKEIGAVGYGIAPLTVTPIEQSGESGIAIAFANWRKRINASIRSYFSEPAGSIAAAFVTGQTQSIPESVNDDMRTAGLYHLLAVSGLNLSIVAGIVFFSVRLMLAAIPYVALRYPIKKWSAVAALMISYFYLEIAGAPVSAERAFLMVSLIFIAILLDRDPSPMRSVAASAFLILCFTPEAALSASFQLSYSATTALIASYEWGSARLRMKAYGWGFARLFFYFAAVVATSLVAWLGTEPFIIYHFSQFSSYSLLANTIAEPLVSFLLMPLVVAGIVLMPLGLAWLAFTPMQYGLDLLLALSRWIASLPHAMIIVPPPTDAGFAVIVTGIIWIYFWRTRMRLLGLPLVLLGLSTAFSYIPPDMLVSGDGRHVAVLQENGEAAMLKGRSTSFIAGQWARAMLVNDMQDKKQTTQECDKTGCAIEIKGRSIAIPKKQEAVPDDCQHAQIVIATGFPVDKASCSAPVLIDQALLANGGAAALYFEATGTHIVYSREVASERPWKSTLDSGDAP